MKYRNGNAVVTLDLRDGTRIIEYPDNEPLTLQTPLNIDIRVSTQCPYGYNTNTKKSTCAFCHESALVDGQECHYGFLQQVLMDAKLPRGTEIALGVNEVTDNLVQFVKNLYRLGLVVNITMNERYILQYGDTGLKQMLPYVFGLGISYRSLQGCLSLPDWIADYPHTVIHVINGIDNFDDIKELSVKYHKLLVLGEKDFGFNRGKVNLDTLEHKQWKSNIMQLTKIFDIVSFDNLGLQQLEIRGKITDEEYKSFYQGEHSMYINAVEQYFAPSSRTRNNIQRFDETDLRSYFQNCEAQEVPHDTKENWRV
jgi:hypothetical protein|nr:MAG TPA: hypothetical protein [Caudoviricetes sp.]